MALDFLASCHLKPTTTRYPHQIVTFITHHLTQNKLSLSTTETKLLNMAKSLSPKRKKSAPSATSLKNNPAKSKYSSPTAVSVADRKKKKKKALADASIELDYSGPTTPKKKSKVKEMQTLPSHSRSKKKKKSSDVSITSDCSGPITPK